MKKCRVVWYHKNDTKNLHKGELINFECAQAWVNKLNTEYEELYHFVERVY